MTNTLGMLDPSTGTFQQWVVPSAGSGPWGVAVDHQGYIWFTEHYANKIGRFDPNSQSFMEISTPALNSQPYGITVDASNNIWFTENNDSVALIGEYSAGTLKEYKIRNSSTTGTGLTPHLLTVDPQGNIWWSEGWVHMIGQLIVSQAVPGTNDGVTEFGYTPSCSSCGSHTSGIGADSNGQIWFDDSLQSIFGVFSAGASGTFTLFNTPTANSHPHDGLNVDANNTVWFDEEFANKLAEAPQGSIIPTPTASLVPTLTPSSTPTATPSPTPGTVLGQDTFQRANQKFWGKASNGNVWGSDAGTNSVFSISSNSGRVINGAGNYSAILGASTSNADVVFSGSLSSFTNTNLGATLRWHDGNNWYKAYLDGKNLVIQKKVSGTGTMIASIPFAASGGTSYSIRFEVVGTTLSARAWATGSTEPSAWQVTGTDSTFTSGYCGLRMLVQGGATATFTSFTATGL
jgi:streptogramin lyase